MVEEALLDELRVTAGQDEEDDEGQLARLLIGRRALRRRRLRRLALAS